MIRDFELSDMVEVAKINSRDPFMLPTMTNPLVIVKKTMLHRGKVVGAFTANITCDLSVTLDPTLSVLRRAKLIIILAENLIDELIAKGFEDCQVFCLNEQMAKILVKHMGFVRSEGIALHRRLV